ncbi:MAG: hypothetical protein EA427_06510 [Spirochaetaceae bacterium]|nr:MAG: hypothetical protein EA427_06510 [Spirochaetaceae bacterium]
MEKGNDDRDDSAASPRPEEIIAAVYGRIRSLREEGRTATAIILPPAMYRILQDYRARLGEVPGGLPDYLGKYELFGVPLYTDTGTDIVIRSGSRH